MAEPRVPVHVAKHRGSILQGVVQAENQVEDNVASGGERSPWLPWSHRISDVRTDESLVSSLRRLLYKLL